MVCLQSQCAGERAAMRAAVRSVRGTIASARRGHHKYGVRKEHYPQLLVVLTSTVESTLDKPWSEEQQMAWSNVLSFIVSVIDEAYAEGARHSVLTDRLRWLGFASVHKRSCLFT